MRDSFGEPTRQDAENEVEAASKRAGGAEGSGIELADTLMDAGVAPADVIAASQAAELDEDSEEGGNGIEDEITEG